MAKKLSRIVRVDQETYNELKKVADKNDKTMRQVTKDMLKLVRGKKVQEDIVF